MAWQLEIGVLPPDVKSFLRSIGKMRDGLKETAAESNGFDKAVKKSATSMDLLRDSFDSVVKYSRLVNQFLDYSIDQYKELENRLIAVGRIASLSASELDTLGSAFQKLSVDTGVASSEVAKFGEIGARFGLKGADEIESFAETLARFSAVSGGVSEATARQFARISKLTGGTAADFDKLANTIVVLGNNFATSEEAIARTGARLAQDLAQFNVGTDFVLGLGAAMDSLGINAERGGTAMQKMAAQLRAVEKTGGAALTLLADSAGLTEVSFSELIRKNPAEAIITLAEAGADTVEVMKQLGINSTRATAVFSTLSKGSDEVTKAFDLAAESIENNYTIMQQSEEQANSLANINKRLAESYNQIFENFGKETTDSTKEYLNTLKDITDTFSGVNTETNKHLEGVKGLGDETRTWVAGLGEARDLIAKMGSGLLDIGASIADSALAGVRRVGEELGAGSVADALLELGGEEYRRDAQESADLDKINNIKLRGYQLARIKNLERIRKEKEEINKLSLSELIIQQEQAQYVRDVAINYDKNLKTLESTSSKVKDILRDLSDEAEVKAFDGLEKELAKIDINLRNKLSDLQDIFDSQLTTAIDTGSSFTDIAAIGNAQEKIKSTALEIAEIDRQAAKDKAKSKLDELNSNLDELRDRERDLKQDQFDLRESLKKENTPIAAITSEAEAQSFINQVESSNRADVKEFQEARKRHLEIKKEMERNTAEINKVVVAIESNTPKIRGAAM